MDLNNINLPAAVVAELYDKLLVESPAPQQAPARDEKKPVALQQEWKFLGENRGKVLILVDDPEAVHIADQDLAFLSGILQACKLTVADVAVMNIRNQPGFDITAVMKALESRTVILFGPGPLSTGLPMDFPEFQVQRYLQSLFLYSPPLADLEKDNVLKSKLWVCLKRIFNL